MLRATLLMTSLSHQVASYLLASFTEPLDNGEIKLHIKTTVAYVRSQLLAADNPRPETVSFRWLLHHHT
jgi:hypothetical protein